VYFQYMKTLYFVALIPPEPHKKQIANLKYQFAKKYHSVKSLNSPPHITLIPPFETTDEKVHEIEKYLKNEAKIHPTFIVEIDGFGTFRKNVIFLKVRQNEALELLRQSISESASNPLLVKSKKVKSYTPHITLAFRDLTEQNFQKARADCQSTTFNARFRVGSIFLLKHNGKHWEVKNEFPLRGKELI